jgi:hypothetical protein
MDLVFYRLPTEVLEHIDAKEFTLFYYNSTDKVRLRVDNIQNFIPLTGYFQILTTELDLLDSSLKPQVLAFNQTTMEYVQLFNARSKMYTPFMKENWVPLIELRQAFKDNDFNLLMGIIQAELAVDPHDISSYATTISDSLEKLLRRDSRIARMICFSYCCYKILQYDDRELLYDFLGALIFKDLGLSQNSAENIWEKTDVYYKHPYYTLFLLKKMPIELPKRTYFFILDHHENQDGSGFSRQKVGANYHPLCDILKLSEEIFKGKKSAEEYKNIIRALLQTEKLKITQASQDCLASILGGL